jgi:parvulin-like peptidyl-prolyl isomerase
MISISLWAFGAVWMASDAALLDRVVAVVDGRAILASDLPANAPTDAVDQLIQRQLLQTEARRRSITIDDQAVDQAIEDVQKRNKIPDLATLQRAVQASGRTWAQYRKEMKEQLLERRLMGAIMAQGTQVTDRELKTALTREPRLAERRRMRHLLLRLEPGAQAWEEDDAKTRCEQLKKRILSGETFEAVAKSSSEDPSAGRGGDLGWIDLGMTDPSFEKAGFSAKVGAVIGPVRSAYGFHLIRVDAIDRDATSPEQRERLRSTLRRRNAESALKETLRQARQRALVKILPP